MKNMFKIFALTVLFSVSKMEAGVDLNVGVKNDHVLTVHLEKIQEEAALVFQDKNGIILFKDLLKKGSYQKSLNLEVVPDGVYYLLVELENSILTAEVKKTVSGIVITGNSSSIIFKPLFKVEDRKVSVFLTNSEKRTIYFSIYDAKGNPVDFLESRSAEVKKTLDFSKVPAGEYTIDIRAGERRFSKKVILN